MNLIIQEAAEQDILRQIEWYAEKGLPTIAQRFQTAALDAIDALVAMPGAGSPRLTGNSRLSGLRSWPVKGFDEFHAYYLVRPELVIVVRVLHGKRDIGTILGSQELDER